MAQIDEGLCRIAISDMQLIEFEAEAIRIEGDFADGHATIQRRCDTGGKDVAQQHREEEEAEDSVKHHDHDQGHADSTHTAGAQRGSCAAQP